MMRDVKTFDRDYNITQYQGTSVQDLLYHMMAMTGEAGEALNEVKKIIRDHSGTNWDTTLTVDPEDASINAAALRSRLHKAMTELVDVGIYMAEAVSLIEKATGGVITFDACWVQKHHVLADRFAARDGKRAEGSE
jgi:hypothetical protein